MAFAKLLERMCHGFGLAALWASPTDAKLLLVIRMMRLFATGGATLFLPTYLSSLGFSDVKIGSFMALTLIGDLVIGIILACIGNKLGFRVTIIIGCFMMSASGVVFVICDNYWILLLASIAGVISPIASEIGPFKTVEESAIPCLSDPDDHIDIFAWRGLLGLVGGAWGILLAGLIVENGQTSLGFRRKQSFHIIFSGYSVIGVAKLLCCLSLSTNMEPKQPYGDGKAFGKNTEHSLGEQSPLLEHDHCGKYEASSGPDIDGRASKLGLLGLTPESTAFLWRFCLATFLDYVANGMALISWMTYFFRRRYDVAEGALGLVIFIASIFSAFIMLISSPLAHHIGSVPAMVLCHTLNSISLLMVSVPKCKAVALGLFMFRILTRELDSAPRTSVVTASVGDDEIKCAVGTINVVKVIGSATGLLLTGQFAEMDQFWIALTIAGCLKLVYNVLITGFFWDHDNDF